MDKITASAPAKLMLLGEHAVVYNHPCLVTSVDQRMKLTVSSIEESFFELEAADVNILRYKKPMTDLGQGDIPKGAKFVEVAVKNFLNRYPLKNGLKMETKSEFSSQFGFGSSSAVTVCTIKALSVLSNAHLSPKEIFDLSYKTVLDIQGKGSGFDVAGATFGGTLYFITGGKKIEPLDAQSLELIVGYSGVKSDTVTMVNMVKEKMTTQKETIEKIFDAIADLVDKARKAIEEKDWPRLGTLLNYNQDYLEDLGVSTQKLNDMISAARYAGAFGAKLSGAGGGDCMIALVSAEEKPSVARAIEKARGQIIDVAINAPGVRTET